MPFGPPGPAPWADVIVADATAPTEDLYSATTLEQWEACKRKVAWTKFDGLPRPPSNESAALGGQTHKQLEKYLRYGQNFNYTHKSGYIALAGLSFLPPPRMLDARIEMPFGFNYTPQGGGPTIGFKGAKDLAWPGWLLDHKTTKDFKWKKSADKLAGTGVYANGGANDLGERADIQSAIYGWDEIWRQQLGDRPLNVRWLYYRTTGAPKAEAVDFTVTRAQLRPTLDRAHALAVDMGNARRAGLKALDLPPNPNHCDAFGGCPFKKNCNLTPEQKLEALMAQAIAQESNDMTIAGDQQAEILRSLQARNGAVNGSPAINPPMQPPVYWHRPNQKTGQPMGWIQPNDPNYGPALAEGAQPPAPQAPPPQAAAPPPQQAPWTPPPQAAPQAAPWTPPPQGPTVPLVQNAYAPPPAQAAPWTPPPAPALPGVVPGAYVPGAPPVGTETIVEHDATLLAILGKFAEAKRLEAEAFCELFEHAAGTAGAAPVAGAAKKKGRGPGRPKAPPAAT